MCPPPNQMTTTAALLAFRVSSIYATCSVCVYYTHTRILYIRGLFCVLTLKWAYKCVLENDDFFADSPFVAATAAAVALAVAASASSSFFYFSCYARSFFMIAGAKISPNYSELMKSALQLHVCVSVCAFAYVESRFFIRNSYETPLNKRNHIH